MFSASFRSWRARSLGSEKPSGSSSSSYSRPSGRSCGCCSGRSDPLKPVAQTEEAAVTDARAVARDLGEEPRVEDRLHADPPLHAELDADGRLPPGFHTLTDESVHDAERVGVPPAAGRGVESDRRVQAI